MVDSYSLTDEILSTLEAAPASRYVYSALSYFAPRHGGELPGTWFVAALAEAGVDASAVRQTLFRMERTGALTSRREGRVKLSAATATTRAIVEAGTEKLLGAELPPWDGEWTIAQF